MAKLSIDDLDLSGQRVLVRVDFNVPVKNGKITNDLRIRAALPTVQKIVRSGGRAILMSHLGRPEGKGYEAAYTLAPVATRLGELLGKPVAFAKDCMNADAEVAALKNGDVLLLENLRFYPGEGSKKKDERHQMAEKLATYADIYVSDAFGTAHRDAASMTGVPEILGQGACGYLLKKELDYFSRALDNPERPVLAILGGAKVSDKIQLIKNMLDKVDSIVIGGAMAYTFLKAQGKSVGSSKCEVEAEKKDGTKIDIVKLAGELLAAAKQKNVTFLLPVDHKTHSEFADTDAPNVTSGPDIPGGQMGLDIGPKTLALYVSEIKKAKTVLWNGPMGVFELKHFADGTFGVANALAAGGCLSIVGGGDSASAAELSGVAEKLSHISTGGGASLELMEGKVLPGIAALTDK